LFLVLDYPLEGIVKRFSIPKEIDIVVA